MKRRHYSQAVFGGSACFLLLLAQISGCSEGGNDEPSKPPVVTGGANGTGGSGKGGSGNNSAGDGSGAEANGGNDSGEGGAGNTGATGNTGGDGAGGSPDNGCEPELTGDDCWICPENSEQYLNQCSSSQCSPFVNDKARLPLLNNNGTLPKLP
jgi:hypothetical protein